MMVKRKDSRIKVVSLGYESAHNVLTHTVGRGREVERMLEQMLNQLGYVEGKDYQAQKKVLYSSVNENASINEDAVIPNAVCPHTIISATHSSPTIPGHSNENKLHQAIGELFLFKTHNPDLRNVIFVGGKKENWLPYVLDTIQFFFDAIVFTWDDNPLRSLEVALKSPLKHPKFWIDEKELRDSRTLSTDPKRAPNANLRTNFFRDVVGTHLGAVHSINQIENSVLRRMMQLSIEKGGSRLWMFLQEGKSNNFYQERTIFNPPEVILEMILKRHGFQFKSELSNSFSEMIVKPNLLYDLGHQNSHRRTDFILETVDGKQVLIECKSAGGGEGGELTKHITDRAREQVARSIFHRCAVRDGVIISKPKDFYWYYVLDAKWRTPKTYPLKYIHLLEMCNVDAYYSCDDLVDDRYEPNYDFPLVHELERISCKRSH